MAWNVERGGSCRSMFIVDRQGGRVATMWGVLDCGEYNTDHAHLIAPDTPELLEALRGLADLRAHWSITGGNIDFAIAKAEGRT